MPFDIAIPPPDALAVIGLVVILGVAAGRFMQVLRTPHVVGFILLGVLLGSSFLNVIPQDFIEDLGFVSEVALGLIGFDIGGHLRFSELRRLGRSIALIVLFEAVGSFALVGAGVTLLTGSAVTGLIFGSLASATAPAATVDVLAQYKAKGPLTTTLYAVVGLDDAVALILASVAIAIAEAMFRGTGVSTIEMLGVPLYEIGGSLLVGVLIAIPFDFLLNRIKDHEEALILSLGTVLLTAGLANTLHLSLILTTMTLGIATANISPQNAGRITYTIERVGPVIYILFFVLVGARLQIWLLPTMGLLGILYLVLRTFGKYTGATLGATLGGAEPNVRKYLGLGLLSQAGVAIGLSISICQRFSACGVEGSELGALVINVITATTFVVQIFGPLCVKFAIMRAGEARLQH
ncbi:MAG: cation:proton antiporter [Chloroflexi bacterium]|nr:cation:proton antiporter [Chloroflexota bacterium]MBU1746898.1 cation:proton antiporter [Chloroflexota bacterium]MBU1879685.1 cation:proton antiporter [Chloroflexota bacterium]